MHGPAADCLFQMHILASIKVKTTQKEQKSNSALDLHSTFQPEENLLTIFNVIQA